jgi:lipopolysaccharide transport system ATP-binding protein
MDDIVVDGVSKRFRIPHERKTTLLQHIAGVLKRETTYEEFWALKDVSFTVQKGDTFGIIGRNGSGKSTLLKILAKVLYPDTGSVAMSSMVAPLLELGVGFQPELTAKENVYIYSSILGASRKDIKRKYDDIIDWAELRRFESMKLKNFSSGMYARLAFSTAIHSNPDALLLVDEVLAVGDDSFQRRCNEKIDQFKRSGGTLVLVSHSMESVSSVCQRAMALNEGRVISIGPTEKVVKDYLAVIQGR